MSDDFFTGWSGALSRPNRRFLIGASVGLLGASLAAGAAFGMRTPAPGPGAWDQSAIAEHVGLLVADPYPALLSPSPEGLRTLFLATTGKRGVQGRYPPAFVGATVVVTGSLIARGARGMIAVADGDGWLRRADAALRLPAPFEEDLGEVSLAGEALDAKCWFGAMRPGYGKTHKACAALCAHGGLPLAFCELARCGDALDAPLFLSATGQPHGRAILPFLADPALVTGRLVRVGDLTHLRVPLSGIRRL